MKVLFCFLSSKFLKKESFGDRVRVFSIFHCMFQQSCAQPEVTILHLGGDRGFCRSFEGIIMSIPWRGTRTLLITALLFLDHSSLVSAPSPFPEFYYCSLVSKSCPTPCNLMDCSMPSFPLLHCLPEFAQTPVQWVSDTIQASHPLPPTSLPVLSLSHHQGFFQWVGSLHQVAKVLELKLSISPSNEYSGLISFRIDWYDLLAVQETVKSLLQHHSSKASVLQH